MLWTPLGSRCRCWSAAATAVMAVFIALVAPANAVTFEEQRNLCADKDAASEKRIPACTAIIETGKLDPKELAAAHSERAEAYQAEPDLAQALADANEAVRLDPGSASALFRRGDIYKNLYKDDHAIRDFTEAIRLEPGVALYFIDRSNAYLDKHDYDRAIADLNEALRLDAADEYEAIVNRCNVLALKGDLEAALADCQKGISQHPNDTYGLGALAFVYYKMGRFDDSIAAYTAALDFPDLEPHDKAYPLYGRGLAKLKKGDESGAAADMTEAQALWKNIARDFE